jgi:L-lysine 6-transaminase
MISAVRGRGLFIAFDLPDPATRNQLWKGLYERGLIALKSGEQAIRFRPALDITPKIADEAMDILRQECRRLCS